MDPLLRRCGGRDPYAVSSRLAAAYGSRLYGRRAADDIVYMPASYLFAGK